MARRRLQDRLDQLQGDAHFTMSEIRSLITELVGEVEDGIVIRLTQEGEGSVMKWLMGQQDECPIGFRIELKEEGDE